MLFEGGDFLQSFFHIYRIVHHTEMLSVQFFLQACIENCEIRIDISYTG